MNNYFLSHLAEQDADEIITDIARENPTAALKFLDALYETMDLLATHPQMGHKREDLTQKSVRFFTFKWHYLIIYKDCLPIEYGGPHWLDTKPVGLRYNLAS
jgi:plasmid stabilization system protein ParE